MEEREQHLLDSCHALALSMNPSVYQRRQTGKRSVQYSVTHVLAAM